MRDRAKLDLDLRRVRRWTHSLSSVRTGSPPSPNQRPTSSPRPRQLYCPFTRIRFGRETLFQMGIVGIVDAREAYTLLQLSKRCGHFQRCLPGLAEFVFQRRTCGIRECNR
jgi:hypothetical protein